MFVYIYNVLIYNFNSLKKVNVEFESDEDRNSIQNELMDADFSSDNEQNISGKLIRLF